MSNTSAALKNARSLHPGMHERRVKWLLCAAENLPKDITLPHHIKPLLGPGAGERDGLWMQCLRCNKGVRVASVAAAADYRDLHYHCLETHCPVWRCPRCDHWEFKYQTRCRFCHEGREVPVATASWPVDDVLCQYVSYDIYLPGRVWRATIRCNSLLRAKRAARSMYPRQEAEVRCAFGSWNSQGGES